VRERGVFDDDERKGGEREREKGESSLAFVLKGECSRLREKGECWMITRERGGGGGEADLMWRKGGRERKGSVR
jgi:hypothetical protein